MPTLKAPRALIDKVLRETRGEHYNNTDLNVQTKHSPSGNQERPPILKAPRALIDKVLMETRGNAYQPVEQPIEQLPSNNDQIKTDIGSALVKPVQYAADMVPIAKNVAASAIGSVPDLVGTVLNMTGLPKEYLGQDIANLTNELINLVDKYGGSISEDKNRYVTEISKFLGGLIGTGAAGGGIKAAGALANAPRVEKVGNFIEKFGELRPSAAGVGASVGGGTAAAFSHERDLPLETELPLTIASAIAGGKAGNIAGKGIKNLMGDKTGAYQYLANKISPDDLKKTVDTAIKSDDLGFLSKETLDSLSPEIRSKLSTKATFDLTPDEMNTILDKGGTKDYAENLNRIQSQKNISTTLGEEAGSADIANFEKNLANKSNVDKFDIALSKRRESISQDLKKMMNRLTSKSVDKESLGKTIEDEIDKVYKKAEKVRRDQWNADFGSVSNESIIPIPNFIEKLIEFSKLKPTLMGNEVAIKAANKQLDEFIPTINGKKYPTLLEDTKEKIVLSPRDVNERLVGLNEERQRFAEQTFSRKQLGELKNSLDLDVDLAAKAGIIDASMVQKARSNYKKNSEFLDKLSESVLAGNIREGGNLSPEKIAKTFETMVPSQLRLTIEVLKKSDKYAEVLPQLQKYYLETAFDAANKGQDVSKFNYKKFIEKLPPAKNMEIIFGDGSIKKEIEDSVRLIRKIIKEEPVRGGSPTAGRLEAQVDQLEAATEATGFPIGTHITTSPMSAALTLYNSFKDAILKKSNNKYAEIMIDPHQRKEIYKLVGKKPEKKTSFLIGKKSIFPSINSLNKRKEKENNKMKIERFQQLLK